MISKINYKECDFSNLNTLYKIIEKEDSFLVQVLSLEKVECLEAFLLKHRFSFTTIFSSKYVEKIDDNKIVLLLKDDDNIRIEKNSKIILYSNHYDSRFIPIFFEFTKQEKEVLVKNKRLLQYCKNSPLSQLFNNTIDAPAYVASTLDYLESVIVMCLIQKSKFSKLCKDVFLVNNKYSNKTEIYLKVYKMLVLKILTRKGSFIQLNITREIVQLVCEKIGFEKALQ